MGQRRLGDDAVAGHQFGGHPAGIGGGACFLIKSNGNQKEAAEPDPDVDYVDDDEDFGYVEEDNENLDFTADSEDAELV